MKKLLVPILTIMSIVIMLSINSIALQNTDIVLRTKYLYFDKDYSGHRIQINISVNNIDLPKRLTYLEEYYRLDSNGNPFQVNSGRYYDSTLSTNDVTFEIVRPQKTNSQYSLIKSVILLDNQRVYETWLNSSATYKLLNTTSATVSPTVYKKRPDVQKRVAPFNSGASGASSSPDNNTANNQKTAGENYLWISITSFVILYMNKKLKNKR